MTDTAMALQASRAGHKQAKASMRQGKTTEAQLLFQTALDYRLQARKLDPERADPAWLEDALVQPIRGVKERHYHRRPGMTKAEVAAAVDADLELYFREQLGEIQNPDLTPREPEIVTPKAWVETKAGAVDDFGQTVCKMGHRTQLLTFDQRVCQGCGRTEELRETKAREDTEAFKQHAKERGAKL